MTGELVYAYAVGDLDMATDAELVGLPGVDDSVVRILSEGGFAAVVSSVDERHFGEEALHEHLEQLPWLEATARAHHAVVDAASRRHAVVPLRMATIYTDDRRVRDMLQRNEARFREVLDRVGGGRTEWGVKVFVAPAPSGTESSGSAPQVPEGTGPGASYLARRRADRDRIDTWRGAAARVAEDLHHRLSRSTVASRLHTPQDARLTGRSGEMVLNAAYLVEDGDVETFRQAVEGWTDDHVELELTGPWAPYSFAPLEDEP